MNVIILNAMGLAIREIIKIQLQIGLCKSNSLKIHLIGIKMNF